MASRRKGRILAFQSLYSWEAAAPGKAANGSIPENLLDFDWIAEDKKEKLDEETKVFARLLLQGAIENLANIDATIKKNLDNWDISRVNRVDLAILRLSTYELLYQEDRAPSIVINEAIGISKEYGADESYRFINGVLDGIRKTMPARLQAAQG